MLHVFTFICVPTLPLWNAPAHTGNSPWARLQWADLENSDAPVANGRAFKGGVGGGGGGLGPCLRCTNGVMAVSLLLCLGNHTCTAQMWALSRGTADPSGQPITGFHAGVVDQMGMAALGNLYLLYAHRGVVLWKETRRERAGKKR